MMLSVKYVRKCDYLTETLLAGSTLAIKSDGMSRRSIITINATRSASNISPISIWTGIYDTK